MKLLTSILSLGLVLMVGAVAAEPAKPAVSLTVKRQLLDSEHDLRGRQGNTQQKTFTLRVEVVNTTSSSIGESTLSGDALVARAGLEKEKIVKESLGIIKVPAMKPNERLTLELGKITLSEMEWRSRKFEESLEEWKVVCKQGDTEIGKSVSNDRYETLVKDAEPAGSNNGGARPGPGARKFRGLGN